MSGQASKSRWRAAQRARKQLANLLAETFVGPCDDDCDECMGEGCEACGGTGQHDRAGPIERGAYFDVHAARELAHRLIAGEGEQAVFEDWCREQGLGPDNREHGTFDNVHGPAYGGTVCEDCQCPRGGWPGKLAREYADKYSHGRSVSMVRSRAHLGRKLLDMLNGRAWWAPSTKTVQPSECTHPACRYALVEDTEGRQLAAIGQGWVFAASSVSDVNAESERLPGITIKLRQCPWCRGTGHNLRGFLPPIEYPSRMRKKIPTWEGGVRPFSVRVGDGPRQIVTFDEDMHTPRTIVAQINANITGAIAWERTPRDPYFEYSINLGSNQPLTVEGQLPLNLSVYVSRLPGMLSARQQSLRSILP